MQNFNLLDISLDLFDGAAAGGDGGSAAATTATGAEGVNQAGTQAKPGSSRRGKSGGLENVVYGKQAETATAAQAPAAQTETTGQEGSDAGGKETETTPEEKRAKFRELINGEYKDIYAQEFQSAFDRRFKNVKEDGEKLQKYQSLVDTLGIKYNITDGDVAKISEALDKDNAYWSAAAEAAGVSVEQYKDMQRTKLENEAFKRAQRQSEGEKSAQQQIEKWEGEAKAVATQYPGFDIATELKNTQFASMLRAGLPMQHAYEVVHLNDIKQSVAKQTAQRTEKTVVDGIRAKGARPTENGVSSQSGVIVKSDVSKLTKADRAEILRRVARGEKITF